MAPLTIGSPGNIKIEIALSKKSLLPVSFKEQLYYQKLLEEIEIKHETKQNWNDNEKKV